MAATKAQINFTATSFAAAPITRVTSLTIGQGGQLIRFKGDVDIFSSIIANVNNEPHISVTCADIGNLMSLVTGTSGTFLTTVKDARAQSGGDVLFTMINAVFETTDCNIPHAQFGTATASWQGFASDGITNPLTFTRA